MRQQVNLYLPEFRKKKSFLTAENMAGLLLAGAALLGAVSAWQYWELAGLRGELTEKQALLGEAAARAEALERSLDERSLDQDIPAQVLAGEERLAEKRVLLDFLSGADLGNAEGFSEYLAELSRHHLPGLSLSSIALREGGNSVSLGGQVLRPESVPAYLQSLGEGSSYVGKRFTSMRISESADAEASGILEFSVSTGEAAP